jgi:hypothetical protein
MGQRPTEQRGSHPWQRLRQAVILPAVMLLSLGGYMTVLWWRGPSAVIATQTAWDRLIPFCPGWVWVYLVPYLFAPALAACLSARRFAWYIGRGLCIVAVSLAIFAIIPTKTIRSPIEGIGTGPTADLYRGMIALDRPAANAAPSLHVSLTCLMGIALFLDFPRFWPLIGLGVGVVWLSTLFTQQHHLIDVVTGVLLGTAAAVTPLPAFAWPSRKRKNRS